MPAAPSPPAKALDILQSGPIAGIDIRVTGSTDMTAAAGAHVIVIADRASADGEWRGDAGLDLVRRLVQIAPGAPLVFAGARQREVLALAHRGSCASRGERLVGSAPGALVSAARAMVAVGAGCSAARCGACSGRGARVLDPGVERVHRLGRPDHCRPARARPRADRSAHAGELAAWAIRARLGRRALRRGAAPQFASARHGVCGARRRVRRPAGRRGGARHPRRLGNSLDSPPRSQRP